MAVTPFRLNQIDRTGESTSSKFYGVALDATNYAAVAADAAAVRTAIEGISLCNEVSLTASVPFHTASGVAPTAPYAQRELLLKIFYVDDVTHAKGDMTVPGPDLTLLTFTTDDVDITVGTEMIALVDALEGHSFSAAGNAITVKGAKIMGRNS